MKKYAQFINESVVDYEGNEISDEDAVWCEYDKCWCYRDKAMWIDYMQFYTRPFTQEERENIKIEDEEKKIRLEKKREMMKDIDPYGEEDWEI